MNYEHEHLKEQGFNEGQINFMVDCFEKNQVDIEDYVSSEMSIDKMELIFNILKEGKILRLSKDELNEFDVDEITLLSNTDYRLKNLIRETPLNSSQLLALELPIKENLKGVTNFIIHRTPATDIALISGIAIVDRTKDIIGDLTLNRVPTRKLEFILAITEMTKQYTRKLVEKELDELDLIFKTLNNTKAYNEIKLLSDLSYNQLVGVREGLKAQIPIDVLANPSFTPDEIHELVNILSDF